MTQEPEYTGKRGRKGLTEQQKKDKSPAKADPRGLKVDSFLPMPPDNVEADVAAEWQRVGEYLLLTDRVSKLDSQALLMYATSYVVYAETMRDLLIGRKALWGEVNGRPKPSKIADLAIKHGEIVLRNDRAHSAPGSQQRLRSAGDTTTDSRSARNCSRAASQNPKQD
jgi:phage terminase small subunit